ncbi:Rac GTPase-activating protein 1, partial [Manacus vitellinus]
EFLQLARSFEEWRRRWQRTEQELGRCKDQLLKSEAERSALDVKLKHARNQVDVEIKRRQRAELDCEKLERQIQLIRELLMCDSSGSIQLSEEQKSVLAFLHRPKASLGGSGSKRLSTIDESGSILSDISFDKTEDSLDWDSSVVKAVRLKRREKRVSLFTLAAPSATTCHLSCPLSVARGWTAIPVVPFQPGIFSLCDSGSGHYDLSPFPGNTSPSLTPEFPPSCPDPCPLCALHLQVIKPESCVPCGKRVKFGKISLKCRDCRVVAHPECRDRCPLPCIPTLAGTPGRMGEGTLMDFVPSTPPMIPSIIVHCVNEIEQRGLHETGLYRVPGCDRTVRELKEKFLRAKSIPLLSKVDDVHAICGLLKDFLRSLKEPLLTFHLHKAFMEAAEIPDEDNSVAAMYQAVGELPQANRDTLAFLMVHLQRVAQSPDTKMDIPNLAKVFGPTIVAHAVPDPDPMTLLQDTKRQPKVVERLLLLPMDFWSQLMMVEQENLAPGHVIENTNAFSTPQTPEVQVSILGPLTTPEQKLSKTPSSSSLSQRVRSTFSKTTPRFGSKSKSTLQLGHQGNFFASPLLK